MARTVRRIGASPEDVFAVLADGWTYSDWVVGTAHIRDVDAGWPAEGTQLHHKAGPWPVSIHDHTTVLACEPPQLLLLKLRLWPLGAGTVRFELLPAGDGATRVRMTETFTEGPLQWIHTKINDLALHVRNRESLRRLDDLAVHGAVRRPDRRGVEFA